MVDKIHLPDIQAQWRALKLEMLQTVPLTDESWHGIIGARQNGAEKVFSNLLPIPIATVKPKIVAETMAVLQQQHLFFSATQLDKSLACAQSDDPSMLRINIAAADNSGGAAWHYYAIKSIKSCFRKRLWR
jgi:hypothetical protein